MTREFNEIKECLLQEPLLNHFDPKLKTNLYTDASDDGLGWVFTQIREEEEEVPVNNF